MSPTDVVPGSDADEPRSTAAAEAASRAEPSGDVEAAAPADRPESVPTGHGDRPDQPSETADDELFAGHDAGAEVRAAAEGPTDEQDETADAVEQDAAGSGEDEDSVTVVDAAEETDFEVPAYASISERPIGVSDAVDESVPAPVDPAELARVAAERAEVAEALHGAVEVARSAAEEDAGPELVGEHVGVQPEDSAAVTHLFEARNAGYVGWRWAVTVACAAPDAPVTVSEVVLLPGPDALTAPEWVPWQDRVRAGDLGVGDLFPARKDDPRLVAGYVQSDDPAVEDVALELGLGRIRVLSREGRTEAASRWTDGEFGPRSDMARSAPATCGTCGFFQPVAGSLQAAFGVCTNDVSPADGRVVHVEYGCGAHSEVEVDTAPQVAVAELVYDDARLDYEPPLNAKPTTETPAQPTDTAAPVTAEAPEPTAVQTPEKPESDASVPEPHAVEVTETPAEPTVSAEATTAEAPAPTAVQTSEEPESDASVPEPHAVEVTETPAEPTVSAEPTATEPTASDAVADHADANHSNAPGADAPSGSGA